MAFKSSYHLQPCRLAKLGTEGVSVGGHDYKWPLSLLATCNRVGYSSWALEERQLGVMTSSLITIYSRTSYLS